MQETSDTKIFGLIGVAGYVAIRHLRAIKETGNNLVAAMDKFDSVGIMDSFFPDADFFVEYERFDRHVDKIRRKNQKLDFVSICTPNYLHDSHIRFALRHQADAICEKPLVLNPWNIDALAEIEKETGRKVFNIFQLRTHPLIIALKEKVSKADKSKKFDIDLTYITSRGHWYDTSWKSSLEKSGGIATNIGVHFFDMLTWIFGNVNQSVVHLSELKQTSGYLELENARVRWFLSLDYNDIPNDVKAKGQRTFRSILVDGEEIEFSGGFTDLHTRSYQEILKGNGFGLDDAKTSINTVYDIRNSKPIGLKGEYHPMLKK